MSWIDWLIVIIPLAGVIYAAFYSQRYVKGVVDYLAAGRVAGRYTIAVGDLASGLSVITLVNLTEQNYNSGFGLSFWQMVSVPLSIVMSLTGYCTYRWRQTRCLSKGQFIELRYGSKAFRVVTAIVSTLAEAVTNAIGPAIATKFFIYYLGLPHRIMVFGVPLPCYGIIVVLCLTLAILLIWPSGRVSLLITDCFQGLLSYPIFLIIAGFILLKFEWNIDVLPTLSDRVVEQSFIDPMQISAFRDFNIFMIMINLVSGVMNRAAWFGNDSSNSGRTPHEQKMASVLGSWRNGFSTMTMMLLALIIYIFMTSANFTQKGKFKITNNEVRKELANRVLDELVQDSELRGTLSERVNAVPDITHTPGVHPPIGQVPDAIYQKGYIRRGFTYEALNSYYFDSIYLNLGMTPAAIAEAQLVNDTVATHSVTPGFENFRNSYSKMNMPMQNLSRVPKRTYEGGFLGDGSPYENLDRHYFDTVYEALGHTDEGRDIFQQFRAKYRQMLMPTVLGKIFPIGMKGLFCLLAIMLLISTDDSRIFNAVGCVVQDIVLPFYKKHLDSKTHIRILRQWTLLMGVFFFIVSIFFSQVDYIIMFTTAMCAVWLSCAGAITVGGLYTRFGNVTGGWLSIITGPTLVLTCMFCQFHWAKIVYPWLDAHNWVIPVGNFLQACSRPFEPYIHWEMNATRFPINSYEFFFISMVVSTLSYVIGSFATYKPFNLDKMLHRGAYADDLDAQNVGEKQTVETTAPAETVETAPEVVEKPSIFAQIWQAIKRFLLFIRFALVGITDEYTRGDRILAYSVFIYVIIYQFGCTFLATYLINKFFGHWQLATWGKYFLIVQIIVPSIIGVVTVIWFMYGTLRDMSHLFRDLARRVENSNDNGQIMEG